MSLWNCYRGRCLYDWLKTFRLGRVVWFFIEWTPLAGRSNDFLHRVRTSRMNEHNFLTERVSVKGKWYRVGRSLETIISLHHWGRADSLCTSSKNLIYPPFREGEAKRCIPRNGIRIERKVVFPYTSRLGNERYEIYSVRYVYHCIVFCRCISDYLIILYIYIYIYIYIVLVLSFFLTWLMLLLELLSGMFI